LSKRPRRSANRAVNDTFFTKLNETQHGNVVRVEQFHRPPTKQRIRLLPKNLAQEDYIEALEDPSINIVFAMGYAGSGKTYLATLFAIQQLRAGIVSKIVVTRPNIAVDDKDIGFLPGDILKKMAPWTKPVLDVFEEHYSLKEIQYMIEDGTVELVPMAYMRGRTFKNAVVILDEAQNTTPRSMLSALTRIGEGSKMIVTGDVRQSDRGYDNGLTDFIKRFDGTPTIRICEFGHDSVERHPVITDILRMYGEE
jgi:phosphate starvation-inducible protein PhoH and related proteins